MMALLPFSSRQACQEVKEILNAGGEVTPETFIERREVADADFSADNLIAEMNTLTLEGRSAAETELLLSGTAYVSLRKLPTQVRENYDFWRGFTLDYLFELAKKRTVEGKAPRAEGERKWEILGAGSNTREILAWRMFSRGQVCAVENGDGSFSFPNMMEVGTNSHDFWMSHVLGTHTGAERPLAQAFVKFQAEGHLSTGPLRAFVRDSVNRPKRTIATHLMSFDEAEQYLEEASDQRIDSPSAADTRDGES